LSTAAAGKATNTQIIAKNSVWYGAEIACSIFGSFITSVVVARMMGPQRLGYFQYVVWLTNMTTAVGSFGLPMTTRKYMAECLNRGEEPVARAIYGVALRIQLLIAAAVTLISLGLVFWAGDPVYRVCSVLLVLNMAPRIVGLIPSQANNAAELMKRSTPPALIGSFFNLVLTFAALAAGWGLIGLAAAALIGSTIETVLKLVDVHRRLAPVPVGRLDPDLKKRMFSYSGQGLVLMILNVAVWDRSDLVILRFLNPDVRQLAFFSTAFNLTERVLMIPSAFGYTLGTTMMAQYGRARDRLVHLTVAGAKYALLVALPLLAGMACVSAPIVKLLYGQQYLPIIPVLSVAAALAIPKALNNSAYLFLQTTENQGFLIWVGCIGGALDIALDFLLIPHYGALGAALANGTAQTFAAIAVWYRAYRLLGVGLPLGEFGRVFLSGFLMVAATLATQWALGGYLGLGCSIVVGGIVWCAALRGTSALTHADGDRLRGIGSALPGRVRPLYLRFVGLLAPAA
jgi:O-antigen/teichoic acid export membrane protein